MQIIVRRATREDLPWALVELEKFSSFVASRIPLFDPETAPEITANFIDKHVFFIADRGGERLGLIAGILMPHYMNPKIQMLAELSWWVSEDHRESGAGDLLMNEFIEFGKTCADWVSVSLESVSPVPEQYLLKKGFRVFERSYLLEVS